MHYSSWGTGTGGLFGGGTQSLISNSNALIKEVQSYLERVQNLPDTDRATLESGIASLRSYVDEASQNTGSGSLQSYYERLKYNYGVISSVYPPPTSTQSGSGGLFGGE